MSEPHLSSPSPLHPGCDDKCQLMEHKGYWTCFATGQCDSLKIRPDDQVRIDALVAKYRHDLEHLYHMAYLAGVQDGEQ
jgi:hypothetical protein